MVGGSLRAVVKGQVCHKIGFVLGPGDPCCQRILAAQFNVLSVFQNRNPSFSQASKDIHTTLLSQVFRGLAQQTVWIRRRLSAQATELLFLTTPR